MVEMSIQPIQLNDSTCSKYHLKSTFFGIIIYGTLLGTGIGYLISAYVYNSTVLGTLVSANALSTSHTTENGDETDYNLEEHFTYSNSQIVNGTCSIVRGTIYSTKTEADDAVSNTILGTIRRLYLIDNGCFDTAIRNSDMIAGFVLTIFFGLCIIIPCYSLGYCIYSLLCSKKTEDVLIESFVTKSDDSFGSKL